MIFLKENIFNMNLLIRKFYYGDIPDTNAGGEVKSESPQIPPSGCGCASWPLWEIFIRSKQGLDHKHVGSLHAADAQMAMENARDVYTRRREGVSIWVVESKHIHASNPDEQEAFFDPADDKAYRHPTFYEVPDSLTHI